jgi:hypothetical protein
MVILPSIIILMKSMMLRLAGYETRIGRRRMHIGYWWESQEERGH